jgi:hypothetical protein
MPNDRRVHPTDIRCELQLVDRPEDRDVLALTERELLEYTANLQGKVRALRALLSEAFTMIARQHDELTRAARIIERQRRE